MQHIRRFMVFVFLFYIIYGSCLFSYIPIKCLCKYSYLNISNVFHFLSTFFFKRIWLYRKKGLSLQPKSDLYDRICNILK